jgi:hypothetical protein
MTVFELTSVISFYYSINFPSEEIVGEIKRICVGQFKRIVGMM